MTSGSAERGQGYGRGIIHLRYGKLNTVIILGNAKDFPLHPNNLVLHEALANPLPQLIHKPMQLLALSICVNNLSIPVPLAWDFGQRKLWV